MDMQRAHILAPYQIEYRTEKRPIPKNGEVLINIKRMGICGSDIHVWHGKHPYTTYPKAQGHEISGFVADTGPGAEKFKRGDMVTFMPQVVCGTCYHCKHGRYNICESLKVHGFQTDGPGAAWFCMPEDWVIALPRSLSLEDGAMIEPLAVAAHITDRGGVMTDKKVLVLGAGPIGNLTAQMAKAKGAASVMITDRSSYRFDIAKKCGIPYCVNIDEESLEERLLKAFGPDRADVILECVGAEATITSAIKVARKGTDIVVAGVFAEPPRVDLGLVQDRELRLIGTLMYMKEDYAVAIKMAESRKVSLAPLVTAHFSNMDFRPAYEFIEAEGERAMKVMIDFDEQA